MRLKYALYYKKLRNNHEKLIQIKSLSIVLSKNFDRSEFSKNVLV